MATKWQDDRLAGDWMHSALHVASATVAWYAGWGARRGGPAVLFTGVLALVYLGLGIVGLFIDGLLLGTPVAVPLGPADNVFHLLLGGAAAAVLARTLNHASRRCNQKAFMNDTELIRGVADMATARP